MAQLRAGLSAVVITPPVGVGLSGYSARTEPSVGVLDDLTCKTLVLDDSRRRLAIVICDVLGIPRSVAGAIRDAVSSATGIKARHVMVSATHTHCGPDIGRLSEGALDDLVARAAGAVQAAAEKLRPAAIGFGSCECAAGVSRRNPRAPVRPYFLYSYPEGPNDPRVLVLAVRELAGSPLGLIANYACHPVSLGPRELSISKDFVEPACRVITEAWGPEAVPLFLQGCAGNINPRWVYDRPDKNPPPPPDWPESLPVRLRETRRLGHMLGGAVLSAASSITRYEDEPDLDSRLVEVRLPVRPGLPPEMLRPREGARRGGRYPTLQDRLADAPREIVTDVQVMRIGEAFVVGLPGEVLVEYQHELRRAIPSPYVLVSELSGDSIGYVPTAEAVEQGGYEPTASFVTPEAGTILVQSALSAAREMGAQPPG